MQEDLQALVKRYQAGEDVRGYIEEELEETISKVYTKYCEKPKRIFKKEAGWLTVEPFIFDDEDMERIINKSIYDALRTYKFDKNAKFSTWFYTTLESDMINLKNEYEKEQDKGALISDIETFNQAVDEIGDIFNPVILEDLKYIKPDEIDELSDKQIKYILLSITFYERNKRLTDEVAAAALGIEKDSIRRYKRELRRDLAASNERRKSRIKPDDLPPLLNEFGAKDPTPREAAIRIRARSEN